MSHSPHRQKRPFVAYSLIKKLTYLNENHKKENIKTWARSTTIWPDMVGHTFSVYNGKKHLPVFIKNQMVGHKLGEFSPTRKLSSHHKKDKKKQKR